MVLEIDTYTMKILLTYLSFKSPDFLVKCLDVCCLFLQLEVIFLKM